MEPEPAKRRRKSGWDEPATGIYFHCIEASATTIIKNHNI